MNEVTEKTEKPESDLECSSQEDQEDQECSDLECSSQEDLEDQESESRLGHLSLALIWCPRRPIGLTTDVYYLESRRY